MRILALMTEAFGSLGGIQEFNRHWLTALAAHERVQALQVLVLDGAVEDDLPAKITQKRPAGGKAGYALTALSAARKLNAEDLVLCGHLNLAPLAALAGRLSGARRWLQLHGIEAWHPATPWRKRAAAHFDLVTAVSRYTRRQFLKWAGVNPATVKVLPNTVRDEFRPGPVPADFLEGLGIDGRRILLTVGRLSASEGYKGHDLVIAELPGLLDAHPDLVYVVVGDGDDRPRIERLVRERELTDRVIFLGRVTDEDLINLYRSAALFVMPSSGEGFGIVFLEAMACGCPVLGFGGDGSVDPLRDGESGIVSSADELGRDLRSALSGDGPATPNCSHFRTHNMAVFARQLLARAII